MGCQAQSALAISNRRPKKEGWERDQSDRPCTGLRRPVRRSDRAFFLLLLSNSSTSAWCSREGRIFCLEQRRKGWKGGKRAPARTRTRRMLRARWCILAATTTVQTSRRSFASTTASLALRRSGGICSPQKHAALFLTLWQKRRFDRDRDAMTARKRSLSQAHHAPGGDGQAPPADQDTAAPVESDAIPENAASTTSATEPIAKRHKSDIDIIRARTEDATLSDRAPDAAPLSEPGDAEAEGGDDSSPLKAKSGGGKDGKDKKGRQGPGKKGRGGIRRDTRGEFQRVQAANAAATSETIVPSSDVPAPFGEADGGGAKEDRRPKRKVAVCFGYVGTGYNGSQIQTVGSNKVGETARINPAMTTIEGEVFKAFVQAGCVSEDNSINPNKVRCAICHVPKRRLKVWSMTGWPAKVFKDRRRRTRRMQRHLAQTRPRPSAPRLFLNVLIRLAIAPLATPHLLDQLLPPTRDPSVGLRPHARFVPVSPNVRFQDVRILAPDLRLPPSQTGHVDGRPVEGVWRMDPRGKGGRRGAGSQVVGVETARRKLSRGFGTETCLQGVCRLPRFGRMNLTSSRGQISPSMLARVRDAVAQFKGVHNFSNYTVGKEFRDRSATRVVKAVEVSDPFLVEGTEWVSIRLWGQSFMIHQIVRRRIHSSCTSHDGR